MGLDEVKFNAIDPHAPLIHTFFVSSGTFDKIHTFFKTCEDSCNVKITLRLGMKQVKFVLVDDW